MALFKEKFCNTIAGKRGGFKIHKNYQDTVYQKYGN